LQFCSNLRQCRSPDDQAQLVQHRSTDPHIRFQQQQLMSPSESNFMRVLLMAITQIPGVREFDQTTRARV